MGLGRLTLYVKTTSVFVVRVGTTRSSGTIRQHEWRCDLAVIECLRLWIRHRTITAQSVVRCLWQSDSLSVMPAALRLFYRSLCLSQQHRHVDSLPTALWMCWGGATDSWCIGGGRPHDRRKPRQSYVVLLSWSFDCHHLWSGDRWLHHRSERLALGLLGCGDLGRCDVNDVLGQR